MTIREATAADMDRLVAIGTAFLAATPFGSFIATEPARLQTVAEFCLGHGVIFVAEVESDLVALLALAVVVHPFSGVRYAEEQAWWVDLEDRGSSIGPRLLARAELWCQQLGLAWLKLGAPAQSAVGPFLVRRGYEAVETAYFKRF